ncbi:hypothetical protein GAH_00215 [Geoglobus ahangari]|uniref:NodB homology domain-containing protein n=1 Tax=Geoglobus ahangari TaxID=113653 RepID=A0A0F7IGN7_9EURY|nr:polysaccharide deacetylase family protein [Geoglobus ahangari]AKG92428.1 hypothetical protein GAH_00215 [Geoglobus ahangari]
MSRVILENVKRESIIGIRYMLSTHPQNYSLKNNIVEIRSRQQKTIKFQNNNMPIEKIIERIIKIKNHKKQVEWILENFVKSDRNSISIEIDIPEMATKIITNYDKIFQKIDKKEEMAETPVADVLAAAFREILLECGVPEKNPWPSEKRFALCLTHDVDELKKTYQYLTRTIHYIKQRKLRRAVRNFISAVPDKLLDKNPYWTFDQIEEIEKQYNVRSTFFFLKETAKVRPFAPETWKHYGRRYNWNEPKIKEKIQQLNRNGWEIGLHGSYESYKSLKLLSTEKKELEQVTQNKVVGIRQHNLNLLIPDTWELQRDAGFVYDMSLGFKGGRYIGFRGGVCFPFYPVKGLLEIPTTIMDISINQGYRLRDFEKILETVSYFGGVCNILWHHTVFSEEYHSWDRIYEKIIEKAIEMDAWICNGRDLTKWWNENRTRVTGG